MLTATPYHHLARTGGNRWWRTVAGTLVLIVTGAVLGLAVFLVAAVAAWLAGRPDNVDDVPSFGPLADLAVLFLTIAVFLPATLLAARWVQRRPAGTLMSVTGRLRWGWLLRCLAVAAASIVLFLLVALALDPGGEQLGTDGDPVGWRPFLVSVLVLALVVPLQSAAEEVVTRGWLLQAVGSWVRGPWLPIAVQAVVFAALHGWGTPWGFADLVVFGAVAGWLTVRTGGLEAAIALHVGNNLISSVLAAAFGELTVDETAADLPWRFAVVDVVLLVAYAAAVWWLAQRRHLAFAEPALVPAR
ncbi:CPBP family intramembrane glutamic endopeptidase [Actinoplanes teichomyceticus]|uniref:Membrane protease YdiL (CAAX protease family) n=1 Tax=Actinoplanes teichomyceticus TaxID=1867 RepID=A0A561VL52_ACTTI|nr:CPBP family intramembrane glutamic endopeptidase [Actinoplanes teichomyceticus]TWG12314.1 membrane protease YdiL (CAAX protease family) [Actinoplanes teichomyceticus]GIF14254.1 CAAX amino protease [Actinoplanes teichomyceticus]